MTTLSNARWERFAQELAKGKTADEAYQLAGYKPGRPHASRLAANGNVRARVSELLGRAAARTEKTIADVLGDLERIARKSEEQCTIPGYNVARAAIMDYAKLRGWNIDRREIGAPGEFERMSDEELEAFVAETSDEIRKEALH